MRIAISGTHRVGKTTLAEALAEALPGHELVPEPYVLMEADGHVFADLPSLEDFELQLERSIGCLLESGPDVVFDRCPLDIVGYLVTHQDAETFRIPEWWPRVQEAVATLDLLVFIPIERPDRVVVRRSQARLRMDVDRVLNEMILVDEVCPGIAVITVSGSPGDRMRTVLKYLQLAGG